MSSINRKPHVLRSEKTLAIPRHVIFTDVESTLEEKPDGTTIHKLKLGWACYYRTRESNRNDSVKWHFFTSRPSFWQFVAEHAARKNRLWVIAHNLAYDFSVLYGFKYLKRYGFKLKFYYSKGTTTLIKVTSKDMSIIFVDSLNWFKEKLATLGDRLGLAKLEVDFRTATFSQLKTYCKRDVEILVKVFKELVTFLQSKQISRLCYTLGSTAMAAYLFGHYKNSIYIHNNKEALDLERESYKGGRTECFFLGEKKDGPFHVVDVNSLYPFVMRKNLYPVKYITKRDNPSVKTLTAFLRTNTVIADVLIRTDEPVYAIKKDRTIFPTGQFWAVLTTPELKFAVQNHKIRKVASMVVYDQAEIFTSFVDRFYRLRSTLRDSGNDLYAHFTKILMNSLYGKFGQKAEDWIKIGQAPNEPDRIEDCYDVETKKRRRIRYLLGEIWECFGTNEARHSFPAIASHVTAYARLHLFTLMQKAGTGNYFYCDTDSLFVNDLGLSNLKSILHSDKLGYLKLEHTAESMSIYGLKDYKIGDKYALKGVSKSATEIDPSTYKQEQWPSLQGLLCKAYTEGYYTKEIIKHLNRVYTKGVVDTSGIVAPFCLAESADETLR